MRQNFRIKIDLSKIYNDARQCSWIFVDMEKISFVKDFEVHVQQIFKINKPFHLLSKVEEKLIFLPSEEDIRILENNDLVLVIPGSGIINLNQSTNGTSYEFHKVIPGSGIINLNQSTNGTSNKETPEFSYSLIKTGYTKQADVETIKNKLYNDKSMKNTEENTSADLSNSACSFYKTAIKETTLDDSKLAEKPDEVITEDNSVNDESITLNKRKRVRRRKSKKTSEVDPDSDMMLTPTEETHKKPRIIDSILISSSKHIRFEDDIKNSSNDLNGIQNKNDEMPVKKVEKNGLEKLISLGKSSTPLTFEHRKKNFQKNETIDEEMATNFNNDLPKINNSIISKSSLGLENGNTNSNINNDYETISFKVLNLNESYNPQVSEVIVAQVLKFDPTTELFTLRVLHGKDQLEDPEGKFSLPKDENLGDEEDTDIFTLERSKLLEITRVTLNKLKSINNLKSNHSF